MTTATAIVTATASKSWTDKAFMSLSRNGHRYELINGEVVDLGNSGMDHGYVACLLVATLTAFVRQHRLGAVCDSSTAFTLKNGNKRSPDVSFVICERLQGLRRPPRGFFKGSPDLAIEILSPGNTVEEMHEKIKEYFENETRMVWTIHPDEKYILVYHCPEPDRFLKAGDYLEGEAIVPGFSMMVDELFEPWDF